MQVQSVGTTSAGFAWPITLRFGKTAIRLTRRGASIGVSIPMHLRDSDVEPGLNLT